MNMMMLMSFNSRRRRYGIYSPLLPSIAVVIHETSNSQREFSCGELELVYSAFLIDSPGILLIIYFICNNLYSMIHQDPELLEDIPESRLAIPKNPGRETNQQGINL